MNILLLPEVDSHGRMEGTSRDVDFPSGSYPFIAFCTHAGGPLHGFVIADILLPGRADGG